MAVIFAVALAMVLGAFAATRALWGPPSGSGTGEQTGAPVAAPGGAASSAGSKAPLLPAAATAHTREGGIAFVRHWFAALTYAQQTGEPTDLATISSPDCAGCQTVIDTIKAAYDGGGSLRGGAYLVRGVTTNSLFAIDRPIYEATIDRGPRATLDRTGVERASLPGLTVASCQVILEWTDGAWRVLSVPTAGCIG